MKQKDVISIIDVLKQTYPDAKCSLDFTSPFTLLIAVMLSAQCTDERVNLTTPALFAKFSTPEDFASIDLSLLEELIHPCGFYKTKAKHIQETALILLDKYHGNVPSSMEDLMRITWCW